MPVGLVGLSVGAAAVMDHIVVTDIDVVSAGVCLLLWDWASERQQLRTAIMTPVRPGTDTRG